MSRLLTGFVAAVVEAWQELRIHRLRVLLSLVGVAVAVTALSGTVALADIGQQALKENYERSGRPAFLSTYIYNQNGESPSADRVLPIFREVADRFDVTYASINSGTSIRAVNGERSKEVFLTVVDPPFAAMHRVVTTRGRWLTAGDAQNLSPAIVVDQRFLSVLGLDATSLPTTVSLDADRAVRATIVGVTSSSLNGDMPTAYILNDAYGFWFGASAPLMDASYEMWVPIEGSDELAVVVRSAISSSLPGYQVDTSRNDYLSWGSGNELREITWVVTGISSVILLLGALSLLNVSAITIQQRVREIGIRRSFGATSGRIFFSVVMESIVATMVAGLIGVMVAIALVNGPWTATYLLEGIDDPPPFPVSAAVLGLGVSLAVGALAGVLPALVAVRVRIIDAIRF